MTATAHALVGAVIAAKIGNPALAYPAAVGSHFLMDLIPHWDSGIGWRSKNSKRRVLEAVLDVLLGVVLVFLIFKAQANSAHLWLTVFFAQLPDWLSAPYIFLKLNQFPFAQIYKLQSAVNSKAGVFYGLVTQIGLVAPLVFYALPHPFANILTTTFAFLR